MSMNEFLVFYVVCFASILVFRCAPMLVLKGRALPPRVSEALGLIPSAAFGALVANDLLDPAGIVSDPFGWLAMVVAAALVVVVARKTGSLIWCALVGMLAYWALSLLV